MGSLLACESSVGFCCLFHTLLIGHNVRFLTNRFLLQLTVRLTKEIVDTYQICDPGFEYSDSCNPKRYLTVPSVGVSNNGSDNENHDLILYVGRILANDDNTSR